MIGAGCLVLLAATLMMRATNSGETLAQSWKWRPPIDAGPPGSSASVSRRDENGNRALNGLDEPVTLPRKVSDSDAFVFAALPDIRCDTCLPVVDPHVNAGGQVGSGSAANVNFQSDIFESSPFRQLAEPDSVDADQASDAPVEIPVMDQGSLDRPEEKSGSASIFLPSARTGSPSALSVTAKLPTTAPKTPVPKTTAVKTPAPKTIAPKKPVGGGGPTAALNARDSRPASQPEIGDHYYNDTPVTDSRAWEVEYTKDDFAPDPFDSYTPYDPYQQMNVYQGKTHNANQRPLLEFGRPWYQLGQLPEPSTIFGAHNPVSSQFVVFGDYRTAFASNDNKGNDTTQIAWQLNLFMNLQLTATERFVASMTPLGQGKNTRYIFDHDQFATEFDADFDFGYFEGDLGAMIGGWTGETLPFDLPFAIGFMPLLVQNGVWMEDAFVGVAATIPARNSPQLDISNMDFTFFGGFDEIDSPAFEGDDDVAKMWGMLGFIEATGGYWEVDYAFLEDRSLRDRSYHNIGIAFTRRYGRFISNSTRVIVNAGQSTEFGPNTADGILLLSENSLITGAPSSIVPYLNFFAGFDRPQSASRAGAAGGVLRNTGILFESDNLTDYPTLDASANDTYGAAFGINILPDDFSQQLVVEVAGLGTMGDGADRIARGTQLGTGFRYQLPLSNSLIFRTDGMFGWMGNENDVHGMRMELRRKF